MAPPPIPDRTGVVVGRSRFVPDETGPRGEVAVTPRKRAAAGVAPWVFMLMVVAVAGFGGYYMFQKQGMAEETLADARAELTAVKERAAQSEDNAIAARAELARAQASLNDTRVGMSALEQRMKEKTQAADELASRLEGIVGKDQGEVVRENGQLTLRLLDRVLFRSGEAELTERGRAVLAVVGKALAEVPEQQIWVQGHTDAAPIARTRRQFASNWELSAARALTVVHHLQEQGKIDPRRLAAVAFGEHRPASRRSKAKNRRIEIVLAPRDVVLVRDQPAPEP
jgi:chemotaxis protein MotB